MQKLSFKKNYSIQDTHIKNCEICNNTLEYNILGTNENIVICTHCKYKLSFNRKPNKFTWKLVSIQIYTDTSRSYLYNDEVITYTDRYAIVPGVSIKTTHFNKSAYIKDILIKFQKFSILL